MHDFALFFARVAFHPRVRLARDRVSGRLGWISRLLTLGAFDHRFEVSAPTPTRASSIRIHQRAWWRTRVDLTLSRSEVVRLRIRHHWVELPSFMYCWLERGDVMGVHVLELETRRWGQETVVLTWLSADAVAWAWSVWGSLVTLLGRWPRPFWFSDQQERQAHHLAERLLDDFDIPCTDVLPLEEGVRATAAGQLMHCRSCDRDLGPKAGRCYFCGRKDVGLRPG